MAGPVIWASHQFSLFVVLSILITSWLYLRVHILPNNDFCTVYNNSNTTVWQTTIQQNAISKNLSPADKYNISQQIYNLPEENNRRKQK